MNTFNELSKQQENLHREIDTIAKANHLLNGVSPIYDGVGDIKAYLNAPIKIMWLLKESYDQDKSGNKGSGDWSIYEAFNTETAWSYLTFQRIAYTLYGFLHSEYYENIPAVKNNREMVRLLNEIAYINISKMPGETRSNDSSISRYYTIWKELINKQIEVYNPDVIIFGGTKRFFEFKETPQLHDRYYNPDVNPQLTSEIYKYKNRWLISVYHPSYRMSTEVYVDLIIDSLKEIKKQININYQNTKL